VRKRHSWENSCVRGVARETVMSGTCMDGETGATESWVLIQVSERHGGNWVIGWGQVWGST
jgi:hypothetical protein